jgi:hypothetical protein
MTNSLVLITNRDNKTFGTGFVIRKERNYSYILTCSHIVEDTPKTLLVDSISAKIVFRGASSGLDLSILKAKIDKEPLLLMQSDCDSFDTQGFRKNRDDNYILESIKCSINTKIELRRQSGLLVNGWKFNTHHNNEVIEGYSGSPLICKNHEKVVGVMSYSRDSKDGFAISIEHLKDIWENMPQNLIKQKNYIPKVFISTSHCEPDISIAKDFARELTHLGYRTFLAKNDIEFGEDWFDAINRALSECEYFLLLLSENSLKSEMVSEEVKMIKELQNGSEFPAILPIRINLPFDKNINYDLLKQINKIQQLVWKDESDTKRIGIKVANVISNNKPFKKSSKPLRLIDTDIPLPNAPFVLERPTGTVPFDSYNYIERVDDGRCYVNLTEKYTLIRIKALRQYGKTSLLARIVLKAKEEKYNVVFFNFQEFDKSLLMDLEDLLVHFLSINQNITQPKA